MTYNLYPSMHRRPHRVSGCRGRDAQTGQPTKPLGRPERGGSGYDFRTKYVETVFDQQLMELYQRLHPGGEGKPTPNTIAQLALKGIALEEEDKKEFKAKNSRWGRKDLLGLLMFIIQKYKEFKGTAVGSGCQPSQAWVRTAHAYPTKLAPD